MRGGIKSNFNWHLPKITQYTLFYQSYGGATQLLTYLTSVLYPSPVITPNLNLKIKFYI